MRIRDVVTSAGYACTDFWWEGGYCRFYGMHSVERCLAFATHKLPMPDMQNGR